MARIVIKKSALLELMQERGLISKSQTTATRSANDTRFEEFKKQILEHLDSLEKDESELKKSLIAYETKYIEKGGKGLPVGTIREWKGKKYIKIAPGKWRPKYDGNTRGAKMAIAAIKRKAAQCTDSKQLLQLILENRERFSDENGRPLPFVKELSDYVSGLNDNLESAKTPKKGTPKQNKTKTISADIEDFEGYIKEFAKQDNTNLSSSDVQELAQSAHDLWKKANAKEKENDNEKVIKDCAERAYERMLTKQKELTEEEKSKQPDIDLSQVNPLTDKEKKALDKKFGIVERMVGKDTIKIMRNIVGDVLESEIGEGFEIRVNNHTLGEEGLKFYNGLIDEAQQRLESAEKENSKNFKDPKRAYNAQMNVGMCRNILIDRKSQKARFEQWNKLGQDKILGALGLNEPEETESGISAIRDKYHSSKSIDGDDDTITLPDGTELEGKWKLVEADAPSASHDEMTFQKTEGFPTNDDGSTINDRDYEHDSAAKEAVIDMSADFDSRALHIDSPVVVSEDGVVISGNNRTMSSKLAARKGTDAKYIDALNKKAKKFGFTSDDVSKFKNPRVVFETNVNGKYSTKQFAKFNESGKKAQSPVETAVKIAKTVNAKTVESIADRINQYDTLGELYADNKSMRDVFSTLIESDVIKKTDLPAYYTDESGVTNNGKEFLETVLVGSVINENNIRSLASAGGKEIRQKLVRAIVPLVENKGMKGYSIAKELNEAVSIAVEIKKNKKFKDAEEYSKQNVLIGEKPDPIAIEFAKKLEGTQKEFAEFMRSLNGGLRPAANGEADIFLGGVESRDDILSRYMTIKKSIRELFNSLFK